MTSRRADAVDRSLAGLLRNMAYAGVSAASAGLLLLLLILASRKLGEIEYGKFSFALGLGTIFETLMDFGLQQVAIRAVARDTSSAHRILRNSLGLKLVWALGALVVLVATATALRGQMDVRFACYLVGGSLVLRSYMLTVRGVLQGLERFGWDAVVVIVDRLLLLVAGAAALWAGAGLRGLAFAFVGSRAAALAFAAGLAHRQIGPVGVSYDRALWWELQRTAIPLGLFLVVINLYSRIDTVMLGVLRTDAETGFYQNAYSVYEGLTYLPSVIAAVLAPRLANLFVTDRRRHRRLALGGVAVSGGLALVVGAVAFVLADPLMVLLFGSQFRDSAPPFRILSAGLSLVYVIWILHSTAISMNREKLLLATGVIGLVAKVALNAYAIPHYGPNGAAVAVIAGEATSIAVLVVGLGRRTGRREAATPEGGR
jgi:O-antigen/teichoic acid export membrane protein